MSRCRCCNCGAEGDTEELRRVRESRGEFWGVPCYEALYVCPCCGSDDIEEVEEESDDEDTWEDE